MNFSKSNVLPIVLLLPAGYFWKKLYDTYKTLEKDYKDQKTFHERHNCVVMFSKTAIRGWPPEEIKIDTNNMERLLEPYLYFIKSATKSIDVAVMALAMDQIVGALCEASKRGIKVRLVVNFQSVKGMNKKYKKITSAGIKVAFYIAKSSDLSQIMHLKYMVKDYGNGSGFLCMGSMNYTTMSAILNNYEDVVFSSNIQLVRQFHENFDNVWASVKSQNETLYNKTLLSDSGFK